MSQNYSLSISVSVLLVNLKPSTDYLSKVCLTDDSGHARLIVFFFLSLPSNADVYIITCRQTACDG